MNALFIALNSDQTPDAATALEVALNFELSEAGQAPQWLPLIPAGTFSGQDGRTWQNRNPEAVIAETRRVGRDLPWDIEHATELKGPQGEAAPAQAWIKLDDLEVRDGAIWGRVEWNDAGRALVEGKSYKYYSPAFLFDSHGQVARLKSVGLTNTQNLPQLPALNREKKHPTQNPPGETPMALSEAMRAALNLKADASEADAVQVIGKLKDDHQLALNRAETPDADKFVPKATHELALNRAQSAEAALKDYQDKEVEAEVDAAIADSKIAPANRDHYLAICRQGDGTGLETFRELVKTMPKVISTESGKGGKKVEEGESSRLSDEELALCHDLGLTEAEFLSAKG